MSKKGKVMKTRTLITGVALCSVALLLPHASGQSGSDIPHLRKQGSATQLIVDGKPFLALAGELGNNAATSLAHMNPIWPKLKEAKLNTVLAGVSWAQIEPQQGKFDFSVVDGVILEARRYGLRLVLIWFASWKNGLSSYPPDWLKKDFERYPRIQVKDGRTIELLTTLSEANREADASAFAALMRHVRQFDGRDHTVLMIQVENEVGVLHDSRDRSPAANKAFAGPVPKELMDYLQQHKDTLIPEFRDVWKQNGFKTAGSWEEVFGAGKPDSFDMPVRSLSPPLSQEAHDNTEWRKLTWPVDEIFMAWHYARFVNRVAEAGKAEYNIPMYVNAWLQQPDHAWPGTYPSGGPLPQVMDIWKAGAPAIDILAPDLYLQYFAEVADRYVRQGNPLFIPETSAGATGGANALLAFGQYNAIGFSPFYIERSAGSDADLAASYDLLAQLTPLIVKHQGKGTMAAVQVNLNDPPREVRVGDYTAHVAAESRRWGPPAGSQARVPGTAILIATAPDEFYIAGSGVSVTFTPNTPGPPIVGLATVEEGTFVDGRWIPGRRLAGDDTGQGENLSLRANGIQRVTLYRYR
jgi:hypothetical protein